MSKDTSLTHLLQCHELCMALLLPTILQSTTLKAINVADYSN